MEYTIALDAMGGDNAPAQIVDAAVEVALGGEIRLLLVGPTARIEQELAASFKRHNVGAGARAAAAGHLEIVDAPDVIGMQEHAAQAVRTKKDSSVVRACELVAKGRAGAMVSAGNSGATLAAALFVIKRIEGVSRPALGAAFPTPTGQTFVLDVGANTDCRPEWLAQFAIMGNVYARTMMGVKEPRVALLSNGEEAEKGSQLVQHATALLALLHLRFEGNVEARDLFRGVCDVAVCDGFVGNVALKSAEGAGEFLMAAVREAATGSALGRVGGALLRKRLRPLRDKVDYRHTGGALLLGVQAEVVVAHGRSDALAVRRAIEVGRAALRHDVSGTIAAEFPRTGTRYAGASTTVAGSASAAATAKSDQERLS